jgi:ubiquinone/menaquinone biosynthesis C-methylase UbiE
MTDSSHPVFARVYARMSAQMDEQGAAEFRRVMLEGLAGRVVEVGAGNGRNFAHYPPAVTEVVAVEPEPTMRVLALAAAREVKVPIRVVAGTASALPDGGGGYDAAVTSLVLCSVPDQAAALAEIWRVVRPGGELRFLEHVAAETPGLRRLQRLVDATLWPRMLGGCHTGRDTAAAIAVAGFTVDRLERFRFPEGRLGGPASPHILGRATR